MSGLGMDDMNWKDDPRLLAYALGEWGELGPSDVSEIEAALESDGECRAALDDIRALVPRIESAIGASRSDVLGAAVDGSLLQDGARLTIADAARRGASEAGPRGGESRFVPMLAAAAVLATAVGTSVWMMLDRSDAPPDDHQLAVVLEESVTEESAGAPIDSAGAQRPRMGGTVLEVAPERSIQSADAGSEPILGVEVDEITDARGGFDRYGLPPGSREVESSDRAGASGPGGGEKALYSKSFTNLSVPGVPSGSEEHARSNASRGGRYRGPGDSVPPGHGSSPKLEAVTRRVAPATPGAPEDQLALGRRRDRSEKKRAGSPEALDGYRGRLTERTQSRELADDPTRDLPENPFVDVTKDAFSTFSIDVDTASYSTARGAIAGGRLPAPTQVRVEEFVNYFSYDDAPPSADADEPFAVSAEVGAAPWAPRHRLVRIGLKAEEIEFDERVPASLVFLVDVSGSMNRPDKLPLVKKALGMLTQSLEPEDRVAIVVYASAVGLALDSTPVEARESILQALERLSAGGSTNGGKGIQLAYSVARDHFVEEGVNRVILCTDGDFNVGVTDEDALEELIAEEAAGGIELTVLGFGTSGSAGGDSRMEVLSGRGNGNYAALDTELEARRVLASEIGGTLHTVAKDVKIQVAWNPAVVSHFRLIGYENRMLAHRDFLDDRKDAGEIGAGHGVTALYEVVPAGIGLAGRAQNAYEGVARGEDVPEPGTAKSQEPRPFGQAALGDRLDGTPLLDVRLRYKLPGSDTSVGFEGTVYDEGASFAEAPADLRFAASVAAFAMLLRGSDKVGDTTLADVRRWALEAKGLDPGGLREGFVELVEAAMHITEGALPDGR